MSIPPSFPRPSSIPPLSPVKHRVALMRSPRKGTIRVPLSPASKKTSGIVYRFKNGETGQRCVGSVAETERGNSVGKRLSRYHSEFNLEGVTKKGRRIARAVRLNPEAFTFGILEHLPSGTSEKELHEAENRWQERYQTRDPAYGYNQSDPRTEPLRSKPLSGSSSAPAKPPKSK
ncbi:MAG: hypothetical protein KR126chlam2_00855 [Chlamydiae bacterium]|nr:hypothetical protein [Chlamydiota bacterium]